MESIYIYGIVDGHKQGELDIKGIGYAEKVYFVSFRDISAVVSNTAFVEYDPTEENVLAHENVIQEVLKQDLTMAPLRFCTIVYTKEDVMRLLQSAYMPFKANLSKIKHRRELGVKVFLDVEKLKSEVGEQALIDKSREMAIALNERLKKLADDTKLSEQITDDMIMNASFLVHKDAVEQFYNEIHDFDKQYTDKVRIRVSGPTAPYNFVSMPSES